MMNDRHDSMAGNLDAYALGHLGDRERGEVEAHLRTCATCTRELESLGLVLADIGGAVPPLVPPPSLRQRVLDAVVSTPQESRQPHVRPGAAVRHQRRAPIARRTIVWGAAAAMLLLALVGVERARRQLAVDVADARSQAETLRQQLQTYSGQTDMALAILTAPDMREIPLAGAANATSSTARAYWSRTRGLLLVADRLPAPPPGRIYQVWVIAGGQPLSAGLLGERSTGRGMLIAPPPRANTGGALTVAITDEPPGGLPAPSGTIRLAGSI